MAERLSEYLEQNGGSPTNMGCRGGRDDVLLEIAVRAQFALVQAFLADYLGNPSRALTTPNFNPIMAMAAFEHRLRHAITLAFATTI